MTEAATPMTHREAWETIPWLANGTLEAGEARRLERHAEGCAACTAEIAEQRALAALFPLLDAAGEAEAPPPPPPRRTATPARARSRRPRRWRGAVLGGGALLAAALAGVAVAPRLLAPDYTTLSDPAAEAARGVELRIRAVPGSDPDAVRAAIEGAGATAVAPPTETGLVRATVAAPDRDAVIARLREDPLILVVATD